MGAGPGGSREDSGNNTVSVLVCFQQNSAETTV